MPGSHSVERFVIEENLHCIIKTHWKERKTWWVPGFSLPSLPVMSYLNPLPFPASAAQLLSYPGKNKIPLNYHIVEVGSLLRNGSRAGTAISMCESGISPLLR